MLETRAQASLFATQGEGLTDCQARLDQTQAEFSNIPFFNSVACSLFDIQYGRLKYPSEPCRKIVSQS